MRKQYKLRIKFNISWDEDVFFELCLNHRDYHMLYERDFRFELTSDGKLPITNHDIDDIKYVILPHMIQSIVQSNRYKVITEYV